MKLICDDVLDSLKQIKPKSIDMIFSDPPYFLSNGSFTVSNGKRNTEKIKKGDWDLLENYKDKYNFHKQWIKACQRVLKPNGTIWISGTYHSIYQCGEILQKLGFKILNEIVWFKPNGAPNLSCRFFTASHETVIWAIKDPKAKHTFNYQDMRVWADDKIHSHKKQMRSVWSIPNTPMREKKIGRHPTQKPIGLLERIILSSTNIGDIVLDPFCGSGTTGVVASKYDREFIGIDKEKEYIELTEKRIKESY